MKNTELAFEIYKHYKSVYPEVKNYYGIIANFGLERLAQIAGTDTEETTLLKAVLATFPDGVDHPYYNFPSYRVCGIAKARAVLDGICTDEQQIRTYADEMMTASRNALGIMSAPAPGQHEWVWIDVATAVTPFLLYAGLYFNEQKYLDEAVRQTLLMYDLFLNSSNGLLHQGQGLCRGYTPAKISEDHWSRGNGWGIFPLAELIEHLPKTHPDYNTVVTYFIRHASNLLPYQSENGMWRQEITVESYHGLDSYEETSGTGLIAYAIGVGIRVGILDKKQYLPVLRHAVEGLKKVSIGAHFEIYNSCPGCRCPGDGSIYAYLNHTPTFVDEPHGAGPVIMALAEAHLCGITE